MNTVTYWLLGLLIFDLTTCHQLNQFPQNFEVVGASDGQNSVTLTCNTQTEGNVLWKFFDDGSEEVISGDNFLMEGLNLTVVDVDEGGDVGEYSCWRGREKLSTVHLLLEARKEDVSGLSFHCWAKSYDCNFSCKWTASRYTAVRFGLGDDCAQRRQSCQWYTSNTQLPNGGFQFELPHSLSPYIEESTKLEVTAEAIQDFTIARKTETFYLRDIIQPDSPKIVRCQEVEHGLHVSISPPASWSTPHSFYSLENQIQYRLKDNGQLQFSSSAVIPKAVSELRVRSRDDLAMSAWSKWTPWKNVGKRKNNLCKRRQRTKKKCRQQQEPAA